jgi:hypothetical protein
MSKYVLSNYDEKMGQLKKLLDTDSKNIYLMLSNYEQFSVVSKKCSIREL